MFAKTIKYTDYLGNAREETFLFNLSKAEVMEMELGTSGGISEMMRRLLETQDGPEISKIFKTLILKSYGERSPDGKHFFKSAEISENFRNTEAYSELFMELLQDKQALEDFMIGVMPVNSAEAKAALGKVANANSMVDVANSLRD